MKDFFNRYYKKQYLLAFAKLSIFFIYFYFGFLKVLNLSPADSLVLELHNTVIPFIPFNIFYPTLGIFEMIVGILFLIPKLRKLALVGLVLHMTAVFSPFVFTPRLVWNSFLVPTLEGQYILKNLLLIALGLIVLKDEN